ncbi:MAG: recombinase family protein, partial [Alphaproteobacteria bacterium]|nr:recombinase family protein [Alphaproteobacteria bacterium]
SLGWKLLPRHYDDGGISGAHMDRPALQALLDDIRAGRIDVVVVYKIDRLTRSLTDFARIVEIFDGYGVSFVSVTQQFNTTTSMGRLTLNVLLSFAQFEREVTAERIRDKIAASKKKGMWMGGPPPLGFDNEEKKLVVNETEAETVRTLFNLYFELGSVRQLKTEADNLGLATKSRLTKGVKTGGKSFTRGNLYQLLSNPLYVGEVLHKGKTYPGQHQAIINREVWNKAQQLLTANTVHRHTSTNAKDPSLLTGLLFDESGDRLSPTHATKNGRRYRYYISHRLMQAARDRDDGWRIPALEIEELVVERVIQLLSSDRQVLDLLRQTDMAPNLINSALENARDCCKILASTDKSGKRKQLQTIVRRIGIAPGRLQIEINDKQLVGLLTGDTAAHSTEVTILSVPFRIRKRGIETKLIIEGDEHAVGGKDPMLIEIVAKGSTWFEEIASGQSETVRDIAKREGVDEGDVSRMMSFAFLAPDMVEAIIDGRQPVQLTAERLKRSGSLPLPWPDQRRLLGFPA